MCGICGIVGVDEERADRAVRQMMRVMPHRGPDDEGFEKFAIAQGASASFGFRRLSILDLSMAGHQPMVETTTGNGLIFNGEIYNFKDLRNRLKAEGVRFNSSGDTEVLLAALTVWGEAAIDKLDGMFAIAFFEAGTRRVLLARDGFGIKPLYVSRQDKHLIFASEVRALLASGLVARDFDPQGVASFLAFGAPQSPLTVHREVRSFPAGCREWITTDQTGRPMQAGAPRKFWSILDAGSPSHEGRDAVAKTVRETFLQTVRDQCQADVPVGVLLSAGVDSTLVAAALTQAGFSLTTFTAGVESANEQSELAIARRTAVRLGASHNELVLHDGNIGELWDLWLRSADRPSVDGFNTFLVCKAIHGSCVKVALSGVGADELFGGYGSFGRTVRFSRLLRLAQWLPRNARAGLAALAARIGGRRLKRQAWRFDLFSGRSSRPHDVIVGLKRLLGDHEMRSLGFVAADLALADDFMTWDVANELAGETMDAFKAVSTVEANLYMGNTLLVDADVNSMAHSIELRVPFLGKKFVEMGLAIPSWMHIDPNGVGKQVLRNAMSDLAPREVLERPKTGFALPFDRWMFTTLRDSCEAAISGLEAIPFLNHQQARKMWQDFVRDRHANHWLRPMLLVALGNYADSTARTFIDSAGAMKLRPRCPPA